MYQTNVGDPTNRYKTESKKLNILIVDDDESSSKLFKELLEIRGHKITTIDDGLKCVNRCYENNNNFDIIFMDYHMEDINGTETTKLIKECFDNHSMIIAYTGDNSKNVINEFKNNGFIAAIIKPIDPILLNEFMDIIENNEINSKRMKKLCMLHKNFLYFNK